MRRLGAKVLAAALLGTVVSAAGAQAPEESKPSTNHGSTWGRLFGADDKSADKVTEVKGVVAVSSGPSPAERTAREQERLRKAVLRRVQVCIRLRQIAWETEDSALEQQADDLEARAWSIYREQAARLGLPMMAEDVTVPDKSAIDKALQRGDDSRGGREGGR